MIKSAIQNQLRYIIAREQYMKPLLKNEIISEEVYNEVLENLYDELEVWKYNRIQNPGIEFRKKKREIKSTLAEQNPGYISLTELARSKSQKSTGYTIQMWLRDSGTVDFLTLWENKHNENFLSIPVELKSLTPKIWIKVEKYLSNCIESVLAQTFSDFELILVDDGSPDKCPEICDNYKEKDSRIKVVHKANGGLASARRAGIKVACGDYVFNLDSDDLIEKDALECAYKIIKDTNSEIVSFSYRWVKNGQTVNITNDGLDEGLYTEKDIRKYIYPRLLMDKNMNHISYYLSGKAVKREYLLPFQLGVSEKISLGEDYCCTVPCYLNAKSVYISKKTAYLYTVREDSLSKEFNTKQIHLIEDVINEISKNDMEKVVDFEEQLCRYSCFMCFTILASAAEGNHFKSINAIKENIMNSLHSEKIPCAEFEKISLKSRISIFLMKKKCYRATFYFLNLCKNIKKVLKKG